MLSLLEQVLERLELFWRALLHAGSKLAAQALTAETRVRRNVVRLLTDVDDLSSTMRIFPRIVILDEETLADFAF